MASVPCFLLFFDKFPPPLIKPHTSFSCFLRGAPVSLNYWCRGTLRVILRPYRYRFIHSEFMSPHDSASLRVTCHDSKRTEHDHSKISSSMVRVPCELTGS